MDNKDKKWLELLEKWHAGNFTRADEQALQRLMADSDAFSREATDGYFEHPETDHKVHLNRILAQLNNRNKPVKRPWMLYSVSIAAALALLITSVWWFNQTPDPITTPTLADNTSTPAAPAPTENAPTPATGTDNATAQQRDLTGATTAQTQSAASTAITDSIKNLASTGDIPASSSSDIAAEVAAPPAPGQVASAPAPVSADESNAVVYNENAQQKDRMQIPQKTAQNAVKMDESKQSKAKRAMASPPVPAVGWAQFRADMDAKLRLTQTAKENGIKSGTVNMILDIKPADGKVRSVLFINKLGYGCDAIAEQFVQQYTWQTFPEGSTQIEVEVEFRQ